VALKIYYVDDETDLCEMFEDLFLEKDILIKTFSHPLKALEEINLNPPDLLFTDYRMPGLNGEELAKKTSHSIKKYLVSGENTIITDYPFEQILTKPLNIELIQEIIRTQSQLKLSK
jgi:DNA-binding NtrC family response regulator